MNTQSEVKRELSGGGRAGELLPVPPAGSVLCEAAGTRAAASFKQGLVLFRGRIVPRYFTWLRAGLCVRWIH